LTVPLTFTALARSDSGLTLEEESVPIMRAPAPETEKVRTVMRLGPKVDPAITVAVCPAPELSCQDAEIVTFPPPYVGPRFAMVR
jgi:hypothetical protein